MSSATLPRDVLRVLDAALAGERIEEITSLPSGRSGASVHAVRTLEASFVVRVPDPSRPDHVTRSSREIACMAFAAERGIGPALRHADRSTGITVSLRVEHTLDGPARALSAERIPRLAGLLRRLHDGPPLPADGHLSALLAHVEEAARNRGEPLPAPLLATIREASAACLRFGRRGPCHNDLNPGNILETAERAYLVDWEVAGWGDPFVDLGQVGVFGLRQAGARDELLAQYLGHPPDARERAHATLARVVALGVYAAGFIATAGLAGERPLDASPRGFDAILSDLARGRATSREVGAALSEQTHDEAGSDAYQAALRIAASCGG